jgi:hypothetical protein
MAKRLDSTYQAGPLSRLAEGQERRLQPPAALGRGPNLTAGRRFIRAKPAAILAEKTIIPCRISSYP